MEKNGNTDTEGHFIDNTTAGTFRQEPKNAISVQLHPNPDSSIEEIVSQSLSFSVGNKQIAVWLQFGEVRLVIRPPYKSVNEYTESVFDALNEVERRKQEHASPQIAIPGIEQPAQQPIITNIAPNSPFHNN